VFDFEVFNVVGFLSQMRVERMAEEEAKRKVAAERQEELQLRKDQEEIARLLKVQQAVSQHFRWRDHVERSVASMLMGQPLH